MSLTIPLQSLHGYTIIYTLIILRALKTQYYGGPGLRPRPPPETPAPIGVGLVQMGV